MGDYELSEQTVSEPSASEARASGASADSVFGLAYLSGIADRVDSDRRGKARPKKARQKRIKRALSRVERQALYIRWTYLVYRDRLSNAETTELSLLCRIVQAMNGDGSVQSRIAQPLPH